MQRVISPQFMQNMAALGERWREDRKNKKIANAMTGWEVDPDAVIQDVMRVDRAEGMGLYKLRTAEKAAQVAAAKEAQETKMGTLKTIAGFLNDVDDDPNADVGAAMDRLSPILTGTLGMQPQEIEHYKSAFKANPGLLKTLNRNLNGEKPLILGPGSRAITPEGELLAEAPFAPKNAQTVKVKNEQGGEDVYVFDPGSGKFVKDSTDAGGGGAGGGGGFLDMLASVESGNRNIPSEVDSDPAGPGTKSQGFWQITTPTWRDFAGKAGVDVNQYPNAMSAPREVQARVAEVIPFGRFGPRTQRAMMQKYGPLDRNKTVGELAASLGSGGAGLTPAISTAGPPKSATGKDTWRPITDAERSQYKLNPQIPYQINDRGEVRPIGSAQGKTLNPQQEAAKGRLGAVTDQLDEVANTAKQLRSHPGLPRIMGVMGVFPNMPGGNAADANAIREKMKSQISLNVLQTMRELSKTGGALGNVSNYEIKTLENNLAALDKAQSVEQFQRELKGLENRVARIKQRLTAAAGQDGIVDKPSGRGGRGGGGTTTTPPPAAIDFLRKNNTPENRKFFDQKYGPGAAEKFSNNFSEKMPIGVKTPYGTRI